MIRGYPDPERWSDQLPCNSGTTCTHVQSTANSYTSLWRSDTPATTSGAKRPRRSGLCLRLLRPLAATCRYGLAASWGCRYNLCSASFWPLFAASPHPPIFVSFGDVGAAKLVTPPHARCTACLHACALHRCLPSPDAACAIERPPTSSPICLLVLVLF